MQLLTIDSAKAKKLFGGIIVAVVAFMVLATRQTDPVVVAAAVLLQLIGVAPFYIWLMGRRHGLPIWPAFSLYSCSLAVMPALQKAQALTRFQDDEILQGLLTMAGFFVLGTIVWLSLTARDDKPPRKVLMLESGSAIQSLLLCIGIGLAFQINMLTGWVPMPGNSMQVLRGVAGGLSFLGIFAMAYFHGAGLLKSGQIALYLFLTFCLVCIALTGLIIANIVQPIALGVIGYMLGAGRPPWAALAGLFLAVAVLHSGKYEMRDRYGLYSSGGQAVGLFGLPSFYSEWVSYGFAELGGLSGIVQGGGQEDSPTTVFERSGNLHMLLLVQKKSPAEVPFLNGLTYEPIPQMLIPRFLMPNKAISHAGNILLSTNYGLVDVEGVFSVSIGWPLIAEAYANFGYLGVIVLSILLASAYSLATKMSAGVPITSFRFVAGLVVLASVTNENTLGVFVGSQFQGIVGVALASFFLMRRQPNPFFESQAEAMSGKVGSLGGGRPGTGSGETKASEETGKASGWENKKVGEGGRDTASAGPRDVGTGGTVRTMPTLTPKRISRWMPRRMRAAVVAARDAADPGTTGPQDDGQKKTEEEGKERPRQLAVPYQNYRRYRG